MPSRGGGRPALVEALRRTREELAALCDPSARTAEAAPPAARGAAPAAASPGGVWAAAAPREADFEALREELRRVKRALLAAESQRAFAEHCLGRPCAAPPPPTAGGGRRDAAKAQGRALKSAAAQQRGLHDELLADIAAARGAAAELEAACAADTDEVAALRQGLGGEEASSFDAMSAAIAAGAAGGAEGAAAAVDAARSLLRGALAQSEDAEEAARRAGAALAESLAEERLKRRRVDEEELVRATREVAAARARRQDFEQRAAAERDAMERLEEEAAVEASLGLPSVSFGAGGVVAMSGPLEVSQDEDEAVDPKLLEVRAAWDTSGRLRRAEPHPSLSLWGEAAAAVEADDLPRLLTLVRLRACERTVPAFAGGA